MFTVCDKNLKAVCEIDNLLEAKRDAKSRNKRIPTNIYYVCNQQGIVVASYGPTQTEDPATKSS